jgi:hypothetical protein
MQLCVCVVAYNSLLVGELHGSHCCICERDIGSDLATPVVCLLSIRVALALTWDTGMSSHRPLGSRLSLDALSAQCMFM